MLLELLIISSHHEGYQFCNQDQMKPNLVNTSLIDNYDRQEFVFFLISGSERTKMFKVSQQLRGGTIFDLIIAM